MTNNKLIYYINNKSIFISFIVILATLAIGCTIPISYYDATTYKHLTELKAETVLLVESFDTTTVEGNKNKIDNTILNLRKAYEYEKGKGKPNSDTTVQLEKIVKLFNEDVNEYQKDGPGHLGKKYFSEAAIVLGQAFDIAISTENVKNKDKR